MPQRWPATASALSGKWASDGRHRRKAAHLVDADERKKMPEIKNMWIDIGARDRTQAEAVVSLGDAGGRAHGLTRLQGNIVASNSWTIVSAATSWPRPFAP
jgi:putative aminopeptidase FrvX